MRRMPVQIRTQAISLRRLRVVANEADLGSIVIRAESGNAVFLRDGAYIRQGGEVASAPFPRVTCRVSRRS